MKDKRGVFLLNDADKWEILEEVFSIPVEQRLEWLCKKVAEKKASYLGQTDKSAPELATEMIKNGVNAKSFVQGKVKDNKPC